MSGLDLTGLRPDLEPFLLVDECEIWEDPLGALDDVTDPATGSVTGPDPDSTLLATSPCKLKFVRRRANDTPEGGEPLVVSDYELKIPVATLLPDAGCRVKITACGHDPSLVGKWLRVSEVTHGTFALFRLLLCEMRERASDRP
jgi:hypothetical protein